MLSNIIGNNILSSKYNNEVSFAWNEWTIVEKKNLVNLFKLIVKELIQSNINGKTIDNKSTHFSYFFDAFENIIDHGIKNKNRYTFNFNRREYQNLIELISLKCDVNNCFNSIKQMKEIKTPLGKIRAWIKLSLMDKTLAENFSLLLKEKDFIRDNYDTESILNSEEATIISGLLVGLNAYDLSIDLKSFNLNDFDLPLKPVHYNLYLRERITSSGDDEDNTDEDDLRIDDIYDQKNYLEELNKSLETKYDQFQLKYQSLEKSNIVLSEKLAIAQNENIELKMELENCKIEIKKTKNDFEDRFNQTDQDLKLERESFQKSKTCLDQMYMELQMKIIDETKLRNNLESELQSQTNMKTELESAVRLLDKNLSEKIDFIANLRSQLDKVKEINLDLMEKLQLSENECKEAIMLSQEYKNQIEKLQNENISFSKEIENLNNHLNIDKIKCEKYKNQISSNEIKIDSLEKELTIEKNWRINLQKNLSEKERDLKSADAKINELCLVEATNNLLVEENTQLKEKYQDLEYAMEEMGAKLANAQMAMQSFKEVNQQLSDFQWENDAIACKICTKDFNLARRKHHCRRCGGIYCSDCSDNKMPLPSSSKPVRVCDNCYQTILHKTTKK